LCRDCLLRHVIEGKIKGGIEATWRRGRRRRKLLDDLKEMRGYSHLKNEAADRTVWRAPLGRGIGPVVRQNAKWMNQWTQWYAASLRNERPENRISITSGGNLLLPSSKRRHWIWGPTYLITHG
jgi:hypothetical protein